MMDLSFENKRQAKKGRVLLSDPFAEDQYFGRSVVYLCEHNEEGSFGFVLNNYIDLDLNEIAKNFPNLTTKVSIGGPVKTENIYFIHTIGEALPESQHIQDGIYLGGDYDTLLQMIDNGKVSAEQVRFFLGYSGWSPGQLQEELDEHAWIVAPVINQGEVMDVHVEDLYIHYMRRQGKKYDILTRFPNDLNLN
jgi:putative transcriptional regulator